MSKTLQTLASHRAFSSPEAALFLVSTKHRDLWLHSGQTTGHVSDLSTSGDPSGHFPAMLWLEPLARSNTGSPRFTDFPSLWACSESNLTNLIGSGLNLLCLQIQSKPECLWTLTEVTILGADQKERGLWGREWSQREQTIWPVNQ